jgi:MoaA/NifB/PqqE/SkfB family radical SAM enzyme
MKITREVKRLDYFMRHVYNIFPYINLQKLANLFLNMYEQKFKIATPRSYPPFIKIEPTPLCQLRCTGCSHAQSSYKNATNSDMKLSLDNVKRIVEPLEKMLLGVSLSKRGEPLLNREITKLISHLHERNIAVTFPTNMSLKMSDKDIDELVASGLDTISVSLDGASDETYLKYRIGGKFELIKDNVRRLQDAKRRLGLKRPRINWKFVIFEHNKHEIDQVRKTYKDLGFDSYEMVPNGRDSSLRTAKRKVRRKSCFWPWHTMIINWDGKVAPCCLNTDFGLGNAFESSTSILWTSPEYVSLREGLRDHSKLHPTCRVCLDIAKD